MTLPIEPCAATPDGWVLDSVRRLGIAGWARRRVTWMVTARRSLTVSSPPAVRTVAATPPGMFSAVSRVLASPMATTRYGAVSACPSTWMRPPVPVNEVVVPTRTGPNWMASAPAPRSSSTTSSRSSPPSLRAGSVTVTTTPGPRAGSVPSSTPSACASCCACWRAAADRLPLERRLARLACSCAICVRRRSARLFWSSRMPMRSSSLSPVSASAELLACTWTAMAKPSSSVSTPMTAAEACRPASNRRCRRTGARVPRGGLLRVPSVGAARRVTCRRHRLLVGHAHARNR